MRWVMAKAPTTHARDRQHHDEDAGERQAEDEVGERRQQQHRHDLVEEGGVLDHEHGAGADAVDVHGGDEHRGGGRAGERQRQRRDHGGGDHGIVAGFGGDQALLAALAELLGVFG
jgi:hypothetical protein